MRKRYPLGRGGATWALARRSAAAARTAGRGVRSSARLQASDGNNLLSGPDLECEGAAVAADDGVGAAVQRLEQQRAERSSAGSSLGRLEWEFCLGK